MPNIVDASKEFLLKILKEGTYNGLTAVTYNTRHFEKGLWEESQNLTVGDFYVSNF
ncbi:hypothetical protein ADU37_CDS11220 [Thermococcus sp. 2319x1]|nr:hypothetical protein ADU37_CDS11220 [Thermococcus sp. 2319x1]